MLSGRLDAVFLLETSARPFFDLLGTPEEQKHHVVSEAGHYVPMTEVIRESLDFLDRYLGPVGGGLELGCRPTGDTDSERAGVPLPRLGSAFTLAAALVT